MEEITASEHLVKSVINELLDPEHELSEDETFKDILEQNINNNHNEYIVGITHPSFKNLSRHTKYHLLPGEVLFSLICWSFKGVVSIGTLVRPDFLVADLVLYLISSGFRESLLCELNFVINTSSEFGRLSFPAKTFTTVESFLLPLFID